MSRAGRALSAWLAFRHRVEGPELDPAIRHSHYPNTYSAKAVLTEMGGELVGVAVDIGAGTGYGRRFLSAEAVSYVFDCAGNRECPRCYA
jgi:hypothetical protein